MRKSVNWNWFNIQKYWYWGIYLNLFSHNA